MYKCEPKVLCDYLHFLRYLNYGIGDSIIHSTFTEIRKSSKQKEGEKNYENSKQIYEDLITLQENVIKFLYKEENSDYINDIQKRKYNVKHEVLGEKHADTILNSIYFSQSIFIDKDKPTKEWYLLTISEFIDNIDHIEEYINNYITEKSIINNIRKNLIYISKQNYLSYLRNSGLRNQAFDNMLNIQKKLSDFIAETQEGIIVNFGRSSKQTSKHRSKRKSKRRSKR
jgi:hypothetical protein